MVGTIAFFNTMKERNAQLSLRHKEIHRLGERHLRALTIVHNYYIRSRDGTTAAERFFENRHRDLFDFLLENMDYPVRPKNYLKMASSLPVIAGLKASQNRRLIPDRYRYPTCL
jgi:hypothetical protein